MKRVWRGPFKVKKGGRSSWKIVDSRGHDELLGFGHQYSAQAVCDIMNQAQNHCDEETK